MKSRRPEVAVLGSGDEHLFTSYAIGSEGSQVSLAAIVPALVVELHESVRAGNLERARALHDLVYPLSVAIYRTAPSYRATARLKHCLKVLGWLGEDGVKAPYLPCDAVERAALQAVVERPEYAPYLPGRA